LPVPIAASCRRRERRRPTWAEASWRTSIVPESWSIVLPTIAVARTIPVLLLFGWVWSDPSLISAFSALSNAVIALLICDTDEICAVSVSFLAVSASFLFSYWAVTSCSTSALMSMPEPAPSVFVIDCGRTGGRSRRHGIPLSR
jgi:hypothetical protein